MHQYLLIPFEKVINHYINLDLEVSRLLSPLDGKVIVVELVGLNTSIYFQFDRRSVKLLEHYYGLADTYLSGTPLSLLMLSKATHITSALQEYNIELRGDTDVAMHFSNLFTQLDIDWEEHLSKIVGDPLAHMLGNFARSFLSWGKQSCDTIKTNITEYLQEELKQFPTAKEAEYFNEEIDELRHAEERLKARIERLRTHIKK